MEIKQKETFKKWVLQAHMCLDLENLDANNYSFYSLIYASYTEALLLTALFCLCLLLSLVTSLILLLLLY